MNVYILAGTYTLVREGGATVTLTTGQSMVEDERENDGLYRGTDPMDFIFYVSDPDKPFLDPTAMIGSRGSGGSRKKRRGARDVRSSAGREGLKTPRVSDNRCPS